MCKTKITNTWYSVSISRTHVFIHSRRQMWSVLSLARILHGWLSLAGIPFPRRCPENLGATGAIQIRDWHLRRQPETHINTTDWKVYGTRSSQHISGGGCINNTKSQEYCRRYLYLCLAYCWWLYSIMLIIPNQMIQICEWTERQAVYITCRNININGQQTYLSCQKTLTIHFHQTQY